MCADFLGKECAMPSAGVGFSSDYQVAHDLFASSLMYPLSRKLCGDVIRNGQRVLIRARVTSNADANACAFERLYIHHYVANIHCIIWISRFRRLTFLRKSTVKQIFQRHHISVRNSTARSHEVLTTNITCLQCWPLVKVIHRWSADSPCKMAAMEEVLLWLDIVMMSEYIHFKRHFHSLDKWCNILHIHDYPIVMTNVINMI